ncbi:MAG: hypothetical protein K2X01_01980 [Cyanobacteria bacterium]|nr:hypothetical protein [Cyanobacteriota bacterium]
MSPDNHETQTDNPTLEMMKRLFLIGVGATVTTAEKMRDAMDELVEDLIEKGSLSQKEAQSFAEELKKRAEQEKDQVETSVKAAIDGSVKKVIESLGLVTRRDLDVLRETLITEIKNVRPKAPGNPTKQRTGSTGRTFDKGRPRWADGGKPRAGSPFPRETDDDDAGEEREFRPKRAPARGPGRGPARGPGRGPARGPGARPGGPGKFTSGRTARPEGAEADTGERGDSPSPRPGKFSKRPSSGRPSSGGSGGRKSPGTSSGGGRGGFGAKPKRPR